MDAANTTILENQPTPSRSNLLPTDQRALQGVWLLIASLGMLFLSSIILYLIYISMRLDGHQGEKSIRLFLPRVLAPSTALLLLISGLLEISYRAARRDRDGVVTSSLFCALVIALFFTIAQSIGMSQLIRSLGASGSLGTSAYAFTFVLVLLHALHVIGGVVGLALCFGKSCKGMYDHERSFGLRFCCIYWHFLDLVWVLLMIAFFLAAAALKMNG